MSGGLADLPSVALPVGSGLASPWAYAVVFLSIAGSAVFPPLPSEAMLVAAMSLAAAGELNLVLVCMATASGAVLGDLAAYSLGRIINRRGRRKAEQSARGAAALRWLEARERTWGPGLIVGGRFIPGGTTAVGIAAGLLSYPVRNFLLFATFGSLLWTSYGLVLARVGQGIFPGNPWAAVALTLGIALSVSAALHVARTFRRRSRDGE